jgi:hypothetical protein
MDDDVYLLRGLLAAYFHQDWKLGDRESTDVIARYVADIGEPNDLREVAGAISGIQ